MKRSRNIFYLNAMVIALIVMMAQQKHSMAETCPCDIYATGGTPCVAAHSTVRALYGTYKGPLYQVRRQSDNKTKDIGVLTPGGFANAAAQDSFLAGTSGTISIIYDQSGKNNHLKKAPGGGYVPTADNEAVAQALSLYVGGHKVYGVHIVPGTGYRNDTTSGIATGDQPESEYMVTSGNFYNNRCCFDYGNAETDNHDDGNGTMEAIYFGNNKQWGYGSGNGPWVMADLENGLWAGATTPNNNNTPVTNTFVTAMVIGRSGTFALKAGNAQSGTLKTMWDGTRPNNTYNPMKKQGAIILGIGGDNSNSGQGNFFEGAMASGASSNATDSAVQANIVAAGYGITTAAVPHADPGRPASAITVRYNLSNTEAVLSFTLTDSRRVSVNILNLQGRQIATVVSGNISAGSHEVVWDAKRIPAGVYVWRIAIDEHTEWIRNIIMGK
jgi:hypothetical protein